MVGADNTSPTQNTQAIQSAILGAFGQQNRTNASGLGKWNKTLYFSNLYSINGELQCYHVNGFCFDGVERLLCGLSQSATNKRIIDGQCVSYGTFNNLSFYTSAVQNVPLIDLDNDHTHGADLSPQFIDFNSCSFFGNNIGQIGVLIAKHGGDAQGSNIN